jgi:predicted TIM-barrel fold metal-dependent hydrolase
MADAPSGWLDIHGHFSLPRAASEDAGVVKAFRDIHFMLSEAPQFNAEDTLAYNDRAGVSMQMLSSLPPTTDQLRKSNDFGLSIVHQYPSRFGLLAALPTDEPEETLKEIERMRNQDTHDSIQPDGFAVTTLRNGVSLGDAQLRPVWEELNNRKEVVFVHPNAYVRGQDGRPSALIDVAFDTARTITDMLYKRVFLDFPKITWVFAHSGGAFPALSGRVLLLGLEPWVPNQARITKEEMKKQMSRIYMDTAATAATGMEPAVKMAGIEHIVYGADCGVPCSTELTMEENRESVMDIAQKSTGDGNFVGMNGFDLFPNAKARAASN